MAVRKLLRIESITFNLEPTFRSTSATYDCIVQNVSSGLKKCADSQVSNMEVFHDLNILMSQKVFGVIISTTIFEQMRGIECCRYGIPSLIISCTFAALATCPLHAAFVLIVKSPPAPVGNGCPLKIILRFFRLRCIFESQIKCSESGTAAVFAAFGNGFSSYQIRVQTVHFELPYNSSPQP
jgi:hypothetical protein